jgi:hypothetical protein
MNKSSKVLRLLEIIYAKHVVHEIQNMRREFCCGCKKREQDCLMMDEHETWQMYGLEAIEIIKNQCSIWHEFVNTLGILNIKVQKDFTDHLQLLEKNPDQTLVESLLRVYQDKDNQPLFHALYDLSNWDRQTDPLADFAVCYFSMPPSFKYFIKGTEKTFRSYENDHKKAYQEYLENKLREQFELL